MKTFKKLTAAILSLALALSVAVSSVSVSAAGISAQMLNENQRLFYDTLVQRYVKDFKYGSSTSFSFWFRGQDEGQLNFDTSEGEVTTEELFVAAAMFVADYSAFLPWLDMEGTVNEEYQMPFLAAVNDFELAEDNILHLAVVMFAIKEEYAGEEGELFGFPNIPIKAPAVDNSNSPNKALNATATAESTALDGNNAPRADLAPELAVDGDINTRWQAQTTPSADTPTWIALDMGEEKSFDRLRVYWETARPTYDGYSIQISGNGTDWTDVEIASRERSGGESPYFDNVMFKNKVTSRYVRIYITVSEKLASSAWEIELYDGEPEAPPATLTGIEITKAPNKKNYVKGTFEIPDLAGMELTLKYSDDSSVKMTDSELKDLQGFGSFDAVSAAIDEHTSTLCVQYKGFETSTPVTVTADNPVSEITVTNEPTGVGLQGLKLTTNENAVVAISENGYTSFAIDLMGVAVNIYVVEYKGSKYMLMGTSTTNEETGEGETTISFMGAKATLDYAVELHPVPDVIPDDDGTSSQPDDETESQPDNGTESQPDNEKDNGSVTLITVIAVVALAAIGVGAFFVIKKRRA